MVKKTLNMPYNNIQIIVDETAIAIPSDSKIKLTTFQAFNIFIYISVENGKFVIAGGSDIIERIEGEGMAEKIAK